METIYYLDKVTIILRSYPGKVKQLLPECKDGQYKTMTLRTKTVGLPGKQYVFSALDIVLPSAEFLQALRDSIGHVENMVSYIELACDEICSDEVNSKQMLQKTIRHIWKKYTKHVVVFEDKKVRNDKADLSSGFYSRFTLYCGGKSFHYTVYPRLSKIRNYPCLHSEWRIRKAGTIRKKIGVVASHINLTNPPHGRLTAS